MDDFMSKPFKPDQLADILKKYLPTHIRSHEDTSFPEMNRPGEDMLDWKGFLERVMGDKALAKDIFNEFLTELPKRIEEISNDLENRNLLEANRKAHTLKGSSANVGAIAIQEIAYRIEHSTSDEDLTQAVSLIPQLDKQFNRLKKYWSRYNPDVKQRSIP